MIEVTLMNCTGWLILSAGIALDKKELKAVAIVVFFISLLIGMLK